MNENLRLALEWVKAIRTHDDEKLCDLTSPSIVFSGPKGQTQGWDAQKQWMNDASARFETLEIYVGLNHVVLYQDAVWHEDPMPGQTTVRRQLATLFRVRDGKLDFIERHWKLEDALNAAGLSAADKL
jgi:hypothetical protein